MPKRQKPLVPRPSPESVWATEDTSTMHCPHCGQGVDCSGMQVLDSPIADALLRGQRASGN